MSLGSKLKKRLKHAGKAALNPAKGGVDLSKKVTSTLHPVTTAIGKLDAVAYGEIGGGIVGAIIAKRSGNKKVFGGTGVKLAPKVVAVDAAVGTVGLGLVGGGALSGAFNAGVQAAAGPTEPLPTTSTGDTAATIVQNGADAVARLPGESGTATAPTAGASSSGLLILAAVLVLALVASGK